MSYRQREFVAYEIRDERDRFEVVAWYNRAVALAVHVNPNLRCLWQEHAHLIVVASERADALAAIPSRAQPVASVPDLFFVPREAGA